MSGPNLSSLGADRAPRASKTSPHPRPLSPGRGGPGAGRRAGKSLIEVLVVMTAMTAILTTAGRLLYQLSRAERSAREAVAVGRASLRLARDFRGDVRAASSAEPFETDERRGLRLTTADGTVEYVAAKEAVHKTVSGEQGRRQDAYRLGPVTVTFVVEGDRLATLGVEPLRRESNTRRAAAGPLRVVAAVGSDHLGTAAAPIPPDEASPAPAEAVRPEGGAP